MPIKAPKLGVIAVRPQATVTDTYVRPARPVSPGMQLAEALQSFNPTIERFVKQKQAQRNDADQTAARKDAIAQAQQDIKEVTEGKQWAQYSKVYRDTYLEQRGLLEGMRLRSGWEVRQQELGLANSTDPADFNTAFNEYASSELDGIEDPAMLRGALGIIEQTANNASIQNAAQVSKNIQAGIMQDAVGLAGAAIDEEMNRALSSDVAPEQRGFDTQAVMRAVNAANARTKFLQLPGDAFRKQVTDLVVDKAVRYANPDILRVLDQQMDVGGGKKLPLSDGYWKTIRDEAHMRVEAREMQIEGWIAQKAEREQKHALQASRLQVLQGLAEDPYAELPAAYLAQMESRIPGFADEALSLRSKLITAAEKSAPGDTLTSMADFMQDPADLGKLFGAVRSGTVDPSMLRWAMTAYQRAADVGGGDPNKGWRHVKADPALEPFFKRFDDAAVDPFLSGLYANEPQEVARAQTLFNIMMLEYTAENPEATMRERRQYADETFESLTAKARAFQTGVAAPTPAAGRDTTDPVQHPEDAKRVFDQFDEN